MAAVIMAAFAHEKQTAEDAVRLAATGPGRVKTKPTSIDALTARLDGRFEWFCEERSSVLPPKAGQAFASFIINSVPMMPRSRLKL